MACKRSFLLGLSSEGSISYRKFDDLYKWEKQHVCSVQSNLQGCEVIEPDEFISRILEEVSFADSMADIEELVVSKVDAEGNNVVKLYSVELYELISRYQSELEDAVNVHVDTKYKTVAKKVRPVAAPLPDDSAETMKRVSKEPILRDISKIGHKFTEETL